MNKLLIISLIMVGCASTNEKPRFQRQFNVPGTETLTGAINFCNTTLGKANTIENVQNCVSWFGFDIIGEIK